MNDLNTSNKVLLERAQLRDTLNTHVIILVSLYVSCCVEKYFLNYHSSLLTDRDEICRADSDFAM